MKPKTIYFFLSVLFLISCKKDEEVVFIDTGLNETYRVEYFSGLIIDTTTGLPMANSPVLFYTNDSRYIYNYGQTNSNGYYVFRFAWGSRYTTWAAKPPNNMKVLVSTNNNNNYGYTEFLAGILVENDTAILPTIYAKPMSYIKTHIKDTTGINSDSISVSFVHPYLKPYPPAYYIYYYNYFYHFNNIAGSYVDTAIVKTVNPNKTVLVRWKYKKNAIMYKDSLFLNVLSGDTTTIDVFY